MPRGGGVRGSRIGGFSTGGFRGGGFRGGPVGFRTSTIRSSGRPFGRTGATRTVSRPPTGPYHHNYYRPRRRYYGYWYYPWYRRFWYSPFWAGYYYRPWYYSPAYIGGGIVISIILALIILPIFGVAFAFPFDNADPSGRVNYRSTETLYYNEYWYEYEYIQAGNRITYSIQSSPSFISFALWDQPFENFPTISKNGTISDTIDDILLNEYEYWTTFLRPGSSIEYEYNASENIDFFIADASDLYIWNQFGNPTFFVEKLNMNGSSGVFNINVAKDYYLVWYNEDAVSVDVTYNINYTAANVIDLTQADFYNLTVNSISQTEIIVPRDGQWYFYIYFDPMDSPEETTSITFDVTYETGISSRIKWISIQPILIIIIVVIIIIIIAAFLARKGQKKAKEKRIGINTQTKTVAGKTKETIQKASPYKGATPSKRECLRCGAELKPNQQFCHVCGGKVEGRKVVSSSEVTPSESKTCIYCGNSVNQEDKYCTYCGTKIGT
ncbi:MAG: zinc ribbon domain-containing protein [Promethearchaeota archaeon]|nr:MAG: zinc ribbon domain-containing protein [Candidatus Lokiarchaeota archaeon]